MLSPKLFSVSASTSLGRFHLVCSGLGLRGVCWPGEKASSSRLKPPFGPSAQGRGQASSLPASNASAGTAKLLKTTAKQLADYFDGKAVCFSRKLDLSGLSPFAQKVLRELAKVPYGETISYGELAKRAGKPKAARAVGSVLAKNPLPIIVPCHRVLASDGSLGGYSAPGRLKLKRQLLLMEKETERIHHEDHEGHKG